MTDTTRTHARQDEIDARLTQAAANGGGVVDISDLTIDDHLPAIQAEIASIQTRQRGVVPNETIMANNALLLRTIADALSLDLAVAPLVLASEIGIGTTNTTRGVAEGLGMQFIDVRCLQLHASDFRPLKDVGEDGEEIEYKPRFAWLAEQLKAERPTFILLDEAMEDGSEIAVGLLKQITELAQAPVIVALRVRLEQERDALAAIGDGLGIHRAHVPTARLAYSRQVTQPVLAFGSVGLDGSKCGERYFTLDSFEPHETTLRFTVLGTSEQDDDALNAALEPIFGHGVTVAARLEHVDGMLQCGSDDLDACR